MELHYFREGVESFKIISTKIGSVLLNRPDLGNAISISKLL